MAHLDQWKPLFLLSVLPTGVSLCVLDAYSWIIWQKLVPRILTLLFRFSSPDGPALHRHPGALLSSPALRSWQEVFIEEAFLSLFNILLGCNLPNENLVNQKDSRLLICIPVIKRGKRITEGERKCQCTHGLVPTPFLMSSVYICLGSEC